MSIDEIGSDRWWDGLAGIPTAREHQRRQEEERLRKFQELADRAMRERWERWDKHMMPPTPKPDYYNGTNATLETDGIVIESGQTRIVVRGDLLEKLATLVTMARMAKLIGAEGDEP